MVCCLQVAVFFVCVFQYFTNDYFFTVNYDDPILNLQIFKSLVLVLLLLVFDFPLISSSIIKTSGLTPDYSYIL